MAKADLMELENQADFLSNEAFTTSAIEGEKLDKDSIRASVARKLGLSTAGLPPPQKNVDGIVEILVDATSNFDLPMKNEKLFSWHAALFPTGYSLLQKLVVGNWRDGDSPMQVVSGAVGKEKIHFEAPPAEQLPCEMQNFFNWWNKSQGEMDGLLRAGVAHIWFVTIHPFDDGNGRLARAITDLALAQDERTGRRLYSLSSQILKERDRYYEVLEKSQKHSCDITLWLLWFLEMFQKALELSSAQVELALTVAKFWRRHAASELNERQVKVIRRLISAEPEGFEGGMTNRKYVSLTKTSRESAKRDLGDLEKKGILKRLPGKGRSVAYELILL